MDVSDSYSLWNAVGISSLMSVVVVPLALAAKACAAAARTSLVAAQPAKTPKPGAGQLVPRRWPHNRNTEHAPDTRSP